MEHEPKEPPSGLCAGMLPGRRVECLLEQTPGEWRWAPGTVTALLLPQWPGWARVQFDSGDALEVELPLESEDDAWRWADAACNSSDTTTHSQTNVVDMERACSICTDAFAEMPPDTTGYDDRAAHLSSRLLRGVLGRLVECRGLQRVEQLP